MLAWCYYVAANSRDARAEEAEKNSSIDVYSFTARVFGAVYAGKKQYDEAIGNFEPRFALPGNITGQAISVRYGISGRKAEADEILKSLKANR